MRQLNGRYSKSEREQKQANDNSDHCIYKSIFITYTSKIPIELLIADNAQPLWKRQKNCAKNGEFNTHIY